MFQHLLNYSKLVAKFGTSDGNKNLPNVMDWAKKSLNFEFIVPNRT